MRLLNTEQDNIRNFIFSDPYIYLIGMENYNIEIYSQDCSLTFLEGHTKQVNCLTHCQYMEDDSTNIPAFASGSDDGLILIWDFEKNKDNKDSEVESR